MNTLYVTSRNSMLVDEQGLPVKEQCKSSSYIENAFLLDEDTRIIYHIDGKTEILEGKKDDIIITFYTTYDTPVVVVNSKVWADNIRNKMLQDQKRKEEWASKHGVNECDCCSELN